MNRTVLLVAIAAIAVVGIAVGLLLAGPTGPLAGALGPVPTSIDLAVSNCTGPDYQGFVSFIVSGHLRDSGGNPVGGRTVTLASMGCTDEGACYSDVESLVTQSDGSFAVKKRGLPQENPTPGTGDRYRASFAGDAQYGASTSGDVYRPC